QVLRRTIFDRQSQSALLLGNTGTGKSLVLDSQQRQQQQQQQQRQTFRAVYLNGAAQENDGVAMREIVQQLGITGAATQGSVYTSNLAMMVDSMKTGAVNGVPVIFILDEFERFACRKPQTLLYALLDLCQ
ncbi:unnamed protein product, partial [Ectocarpus sp. 13 AM-2016]